MIFEKDYLNDWLITRIHEKALVKGLEPFIKYFKAHFMRIFGAVKASHVSLHFQVFISRFGSGHLFSEFRYITKRDTFVIKQ